MFRMPTIKELQERLDIDESNAFEIQRIFAEATDLFLVHLPKDRSVEEKHGLVKGSVHWAWNERGLTGDDLVWVIGRTGALFAMTDEDYERVVPE